MVKRFIHFVNTNLFHSSRSQGNYTNIPRRLNKKSKFKINGKGNSITVAGLCRKSRASIRGENNSLDIGEACDFSHSCIQIEGKNCTVRVLSGCLFLNTTIICMGNNCTVTIGRNTTANSAGSLYIVCMGESNYINIGKECMIADAVDIWASDTHPIFDAEKRLLNPSRPINIGNHVWLGRYVKILKGASIGDGAVIGMSSVVTKDIKPNSLNARNPCKCLKENVSWGREYIYPYEVSQPSS